MSHHHDDHHHEPEPSTTTASDHMDMMKMYFHVGFEPVVLLQQWTANTFSAMSLTCLFFFVLAIIYELLKAYRRVLAVKIMQQSVVHLSVKTRGASISNGSGATNADIGNGSLSNEPVVLIRSTGSAQCDTNCANNRARGVRIAEGSNERDVEEQLAGGNDSHLANGLQLFSSLDEMFTCGHLRSTLLYLLQVMFAYLLMLAFMLFNVWISAAILAGAAVGHFLISQKAIALQDATNEDSCH